MRQRPRVESREVKWKYLKTPQVLIFWVAICYREEWVADHVAYLHHHFIQDKWQCSSRKKTTVNIQYSYRIATDYITCVCNIQKETRNCPTACIQHHKIISCKILEFHAGCWKGNKVFQRWCYLPMTPIGLFSPRESLYWTDTTQCLVVMETYSSRFDLVHRSHQVEILPPFPPHSPPTNMATLGAEPQRSRDLPFCIQMLFSLVLIHSTFLKMCNSVTTTHKQKDTRAKRKHIIRN